MPCHVDRLQTVIFGDSYHWQGSQCKLFKGEVKISLEPTGSQLISAQNNSQTKVAHLEDVSSESFQLKTQSTFYVKS